MRMTAMLDITKPSEQVGNILICTQKISRSRPKIIYLTSFRPLDCGLLQVQD